MLRRVVALLALPMAGLFAQTSAERDSARFAAQGGLVRMTITPINNAEFRIVGFLTDSSIAPRYGRANHVVDLSLSAREAITVGTDSTARVHVEVAQNGRVIASGDGRFVTVRKDTARVSLAVDDRAPRPLAPPD